MYQFIAYFIMDVITFQCWDWSRSVSVLFDSYTCIIKTEKGTFAPIHIIRHNAQFPFHYNDVIMSAMASHITSVSIVCWARRRSKHQSSESLAFDRGIHRWPVVSPHKGPVMRKMFPFDDVIMWRFCLVCIFASPNHMFIDDSEHVLTLKAEFRGN